MKYFLFANNKSIHDNNYYDIILNFYNSDDIIVTFNHCLPLKHILQDPVKRNIIHFSRNSFTRPIPYSGLHILDIHKDVFQKIFLWPHPDSIPNAELKVKVLEYLKTQTNFKTSDISHMPGYSTHQSTRDLRTLFLNSYNKVPFLSTGLVGYNYLHQIKNPEDEIFLIGFTHSMDLNRHNWEAERDFFAEEKEKGKCRMITLK